MEKQTAVELLEDKINKVLGHLPIERSFVKIAIEEFKIKEKEQIIETYNKAHSDGYKDIDKFGEQYYNETFKVK